MFSGTRLKAVREARGLDQQTLADAAHTTQSLISMLESGKRPNPEYATVVRLARALGVPLTALDPELLPAEVAPVTVEALAS